MKNILIILFIINILFLKAEYFTRITTGEIVTDNHKSCGISWHDINDDGFLDIYVSNWSQNNCLYINDQEGNFTKVLNQNLVEDGKKSYSCYWIDYDNDGLVDLFSPSDQLQQNLLFHNVGNSEFEQILDGELINLPGHYFGSSWGDYDNDGFIDVYLVTYFPDQPNYLYHNINGESFERIIEGDIANLYAYSFSSSWADFDNDNDPDLFVACSANMDNVLYINSGNSFLEYFDDTIITNDSSNSHTNSWADFDNDGDLDLFIGNTGFMSNYLYKNQGNEMFEIMENIVIYNDLFNTVSSSWGDIDNDGDLDLFITNGYYDEERNNYLYINNGDDDFERIDQENIATDGGCSLGCSFADYDNDGFLDLFVANGAYSSTGCNYLYKNNGNQNNWIEMDLTGIVSNSIGIGAKVEVSTTIFGETSSQIRYVDSTSGRASQNPYRLHFGLGDANVIEQLIIHWPSGLIQELEDIDINQILNITEEDNENLIAFYPFNGNANDESGNDLNGTVLGATLTTDRFGNENSAYYFDGIDDYIDVEDNDLLDITQEFTLSCWIKQDENIENKTIIAKHGITYPERSYALNASAAYDNKPIIKAYHGNDYDLCRTQQNIDKTVWTHIVAMYDQNELSLYINGELNNSEEIGNITLNSNDNPLRIGGYSEYLQPYLFNGKIDDIMIYSRALNDDEILALFDNYQQYNELTLQIENTISGSFMNRLIPVYLTNNTDELYSAEISFELSDDITFNGVVLENSLMGNADWSCSFNVTEEQILFASTGSQPIVDDGILFYLDITSPENIGNYPINFFSAIFNESIESVTLNGDLEVFDAVFGDVDLNGIVQAFDASQILRFLVEEIELNEYQQYNADVTLDGSISSLDAMFISQYITEIIDDLPVQPAENMNNPTGSIEFTEISTDVGEFVQIPINLVNPENIYSFYFNISYDPEIFSFVTLDDSNCSEYLTYEFYQSGDNLIISGYQSDGNELSELPSIKFFIPEDVQFVSSEISFDEICWNEDNPIIDSGEFIVNNQFSGVPDSNFEVSHLNQNYPNPFNPDTTISFYLKISDSIELSIFNIKGQKVKTLVDKFSEKGSYEIQWNGKDENGDEVKSGIFFYKLKTKDEELSRKMILLK
ncbi:MAG: FG-GAP-like repeat-containing protein [Candidatus Cloacimonetes bacterium]|nr:FG-GAP-like repeat-containing protein [Candidatus Cloacimonadota bacterium]